MKTFTETNIKLMNMASNFDEILSSLLERMDKEPNQSADALIEKECNKLNLSEQSKAVLAETNELIDGFAENMNSLQAAKANGTSRKEWFLQQMDKTLEGRDEAEKAKVITVISDACENQNNETLKTEEE